MEGRQRRECDLSMVDPGAATNSDQVEDFDPGGTRHRPARAWLEERLRDEGTKRLLNSIKKNKHRTKNNNQIN